LLARGPDTFGSISCWDIVGERCQKYTGIIWMIELSRRNGVIKLQPAHRRNVCTRIEKKRINRGYDDYFLITNMEMLGGIVKKKM
jgi:hypothetical protein